MELKQGKKQDTMNITSKYKMDILGIKNTLSHMKNRK